jgi:hypothetical protein
MVVELQIYRNASELIKRVFTLETKKRTGGVHKNPSEETRRKK